MFLRATLWLHSHYQAEETNPRFCPNVTQIFYFFYPGLRRCKNVDLHHARTKYVANATRTRTPGCKVDAVFPRHAHGCRPISATQQWRAAKSDKIGKFVSKTSFIFADSIQAKKKKKNLEGNDRIGVKPGQNVNVCMQGVSADSRVLVKDRYGSLQVMNCLDTRIQSE